VDDVPEGEDDVTRTDLPVTRRDSGGAHTGPGTDRVRIVGAEPAGEITGELPVVQREGVDAGVDPDAADQPREETLFDQSSVHVIDEPGEAKGPAVEPVRPGETAVPGGGTPTELPHWTEPPTGQVPAVLSRDGGDESSGPGVSAPTWREEDSDWVAHDEEFEPAMFGDDEVALGSLDETDDTAPDRRPWEFDLDSPQPSGPVRKVTRVAAGEADAEDPITEPTEVVTPTPTPVAKARPPAASTSRPADPDEAAEPTTVVPTVAAATAVTAAATAPTAAETVEPSARRPAEPIAPGTGLLPDDRAADEEAFADKTVPTGSSRLGRARRAGLLPARMRAKRPGDDPSAEAPLAAELPGASVTDVPGAGRKRVGVAGLAAADRTAERAGETATETARTSSTASTSSPATDPAPAGAEVAAAAGAGTGLLRRSLRRPAPSRPAAPETAPAAPAAGELPTGGGPPAPRRLRSPSGGPHQAGGSSVGVRVGTGIAVAVVALLAFKLGTVPSLVLSAIVVTFAAGECFGVLRRAGYHPASLLGLVGTISLMVGAYAKGVAALPLVLVLITVFTLIWYLFGIERGSPVAGTAATLLTVGWVSLLGAYAGLLLSPSAFPDRHGIAFLLGAIIATVANDVGALAIGGWLGSRPLAPNISPNKTWEGLFGGAVFSILFSTVVVGAIHPWSPSNAALLGVVVAVVAPHGDLCESLLKRDLGLKDMGRLLPGHGGVLDRVDALLFVLPATYYLVRALNIA
jgi:phosphatidate cytidylyltransferase